MNEHFGTLDETIRMARADCEAQLKTMSDKLLAAEIEATLAKDMLAKAILAKEDAIQVASRLIENFGIAEHALGRARQYALALQPAAPAPAADHPLLPKVEPEG